MSAGLTRRGADSQSDILASKLDAELLESDAAMTTPAAAPTSRIPITLYQYKIRLRDVCTAIPERRDWRARDASR
jgi:hypothetical protein